MKGKLFEGCWGVTRGREVVGPIKYSQHHHYPYYIGNEDDPESEWFVHGEWLEVGREYLSDIIATLNSEASARAWVNREPWWKRPVVWYGVAAVIVAPWLLLGCQTTEPAPVICRSLESSNGKDTVVVVPCDAARAGRDE